MFVTIPTLSDTNLPADTPVNNAPLPRRLVALMIPERTIVPIPVYSPNPALSFDAVTVPSAGVPTLTELPNAIMKIFASAVGGFENVI